MRFDLGTLDSGERSLPFGLLVKVSMLQDLVVSENGSNTRYAHNDIKSNENHKPPIRKSVGYGFDQRNVFRITTAIKLR